jgi:hypothetical protein
MHHSLIIPGLLDALDGQPGAAFPTLETVLARGEARFQAQLVDAYAARAAAFGLASGTRGIAALDAHAGGDEAADLDWWWASPIRCAGGLNGLVPLAEASFSSAQWQKLLPELSANASALGFDLRRISASGCLLARATPLDVDAPPPARSLGRSLLTAISGPDRGLWHKFCNATSMILAQHIDHDDGTATGLWLWGGGRLSELRPTRGYATVHAADPALHALARLGPNGSGELIECDPIDSVAAAVATDSSRVATTLQLLRRGEIESLELALPGRRGGLCLRVRRFHLARIWRRRRPLREAVNSEAYHVGRNTSA